MGQYSPKVTRKASSMTSKSLFETYREACSVERFAHHKSGKTDIDALTSYAWNIALSEALYPSLQNLEIGLRNRIASAISDSYGNPWWFDDPAIVDGTLEMDDVERAEARLQKRGMAITPPAIISELNFGFWSRLLASHYDVAIWRKAGIIQAVFPYMPHPRRRKEAFERFDQIRILRNHVFHHESILHLDLRKEHADIMQAMGWLDRSLQKVTQALDRFPEVYTENYKENLKLKLMRACPVESKVLIAARKIARIYYRFL